MDKRNYFVVRRAEVKLEKAKDEKTDEPKDKKKVDELKRVENRFNEAKALREFLVSVGVDVPPIPYEGDIDGYISKLNSVKKTFNNAKKGKFNLESLEHIKALFN